MHNIRDYGTFAQSGMGAHIFIYSVNPNKIKYKGVTNDSRVCIRKTPGLESAILKLN